MPFSCFVSLADFVFVSIFRFLFGQDWPIHYLYIYVSERADVLFFIVQLVFDFFNTRHGSLYLSRIEFLQLIFGNTERLISCL